MVDDTLVLKASNITKKFGRQVVLDGVSLELHSGRIYGLIGKNGAGKTTLMRILTGLSFPTSGEMELYGQTSRAGYEKELRKVGTLIEAPSIDLKLTAEQNMRVYRKLKGVPNDKQENAALLQMVGLEKESRKRAGNFSLGMKQRLGIALAMIGKPELLILDEPINGLDPVGVIEMRSLLKELAAEQKITILVSSHNLPELHQVATDYIILNRARILKELTLNQLNQECVREIYIDSEDCDSIAKVLQQNQVPFEKIAENCIHVLDYNYAKESLMKQLSVAKLELKYNYYVKGQSLEEYYIKLLEEDKNA